MNIVKLKEPELNFATFSAGSDALAHAKGYIDVDTSQARLYTDMHDQLFQAAIYALGIPNNSRLAVILALPYGWHDANSEKISKRLTGEHHILSDNKKLSIYTDVQTERQGILALVNMAFGWLSGVNQDILNNSILHDCGGMTTEHIYIKNRKDTDSSDSDENLGQWSIATQLKQYLSDEYHLTRTETECLEYIANKGLYDDTTGDINLAAFLHQANEKLAKRIVQSAKNRIRQYGEVKRKYITGGKGPELFPFISKIVPGCILSKDPLFDNTLGAVKTAMNLVTPAVIPVGIDIGNQNTKAAAILGGECHCVMFPSFTGDRSHGRTY